MKNQNSTNYTFPLVVLTTLFFAWGFITALNDVLIPYLKAVFELTNFQSTLVQMAFFGAYFIGALVYFIISVISGDPIAKIGYKNGIIVGLIISAIGCLLFIPAVSFHVYNFFLGALFTLGLGLTMLQISANPYVILLGSPETASARLNLSQGFNSFGTTISPVIGGFLIFEYFGSEATGASAVKIPYLVLALAFFVLGIMVKFIRLPHVEEEEISGGGASALRYKNLVMGIGAIFCYVGAEVAVGSFLVSFLGLPEIAGLDHGTASKMLALYWGGAMAGRFMGAVSMSESLNTLRKMLLMAAIGLGTYALIAVLSGIGFSNSAPFLLFLVLNMLMFHLSRGKAARVLLFFSLTAIVLLLIGVFTVGNVAFWAMLSLGLFNSIMWSNIFSLAVAGLGKDTSQGSSLLVMAIVGGALIPPMQGLIADQHGLHISFLLPVLCYLYIAAFAVFGSRTSGSGD